MSATVAVACERKKKRGGRVSGGSFNATDGESPSVAVFTPPIFTPLINGAIDPVEEKEAENLRSQFATLNRLFLLLVCIRHRN
jgi:hypothetical protein